MRCAAALHTVAGLGQRLLMFAPRLAQRLRLRFKGHQTGPCVGQLDLGFVELLLGFLPLLRQPRGALLGLFEAYLERLLLRQLLRVA